MDEKTKLENGKYTCMECKNENDLTEEKQDGDVIECEYCGIEYEVKHTDDGTMLSMIEEEK